MKSCGAAGKLIQKQQGSQSLYLSLGINASLNYKEKICWFAKRWSWIGGAIAGRIHRRVFSKLAFFSLQNETGTIQLYLDKTKFPKNSESDAFNHIKQLTDVEYSKSKHQSSRLKRVSCLSTSNSTPFYSSYYLYRISSIVPTDTESLIDSICWLNYWQQKYIKPSTQGAVLGGNSGVGFSWARRLGDVLVAYGFWF